jgi:16S rRNA U516 pseudouridylate synthase RsuA-like enzyme
MNEEKFNMSLRKFLKNVGVTSQQQIEKAVREGNFTGDTFKVKVVLTAPGTDLNHTVEGEIEVG